MPDNLIDAIAEAERLYKAHHADPSDITAWRGWSNAREKIVLPLIAAYRQQAADLALHKQLGDKQAQKLAQVQSKVAPYRQPGCNSGAHGLANEVYEIVAGEN
jgi:hypothetical protein